MADLGTACDNLWYRRRRLALKIKSIVFHGKLSEIFVATPTHQRDLDLCRCCTFLCLFELENKKTKNKKNSNNWKFFQQMSVIPVYTCRVKRELLYCTQHVFFLVMILMPFLYLTSS